MPALRDEDFEQYAKLGLLGTARCTACSTFCRADDRQTRRSTDKQTPNKRTACWTVGCKFECLAPRRKPAEPCSKHSQLCMGKVDMKSRSATSRYHQRGLLDGPLFKIFPRLVLGRIDADFCDCKKTTQNSAFFELRVYICFRIFDNICIILELLLF